MNNEINKKNVASKQLNGSLESKYNHLWNIFDKEEIILEVQIDKKGFVHLLNVSKIELPKELPETTEEESNDELNKKYITLRNNDLKKKQKILNYIGYW